MKRLIGIAVTLMVVITQMARGQGLGLPIAEVAAPSDAGLSRATVGVVAGDDVSVYGARASYGLPNVIATLFGDIGVVDFQGLDYGASIQIGGQCALNVAVPVDLALRGSLFTTIAGDVDIAGVALTGLVSGQVIQIPILSVYGGLGVAQTRWNADADITDWEDHDEINVTLTAGGIVKLSPTLSFYAEVSHVDDAFLGAGIRLEL